MLAVLVKEFIQLTRDRLTYAMILAVPVIQILLFGYAINTDPRHLPTAVLVQENSVVRALDRRRHRQFAPISTITHQARTPAELDALVADRRRSSSRSPSPATSPAAWCAATAPRSWSRPTPPIRPRPAARWPPRPAAARRRCATISPAPPRRRPIAAPPFEVVVHRRYNPENITAYNIVPGLLGIVLTLTLVMMTAIGVTRELSAARWRACWRRRSSRSR